MRKVLGIYSIRNGVPLPNSVQLGILLGLAGFMAISVVSIPSYTSAESASGIVTVTASVMTAPPIITSPHHDQRLNNEAITLHGTCQADLTVKLFNNGMPVGATTCTKKANFGLPIKLQPGSNKITAGHYRPGPVSALSEEITIYHEPGALTKDSEDMLTDHSISNWINNSYALLVIRYAL